MDNGDCVDVIYTDFAKAFDKVPHKRLLKKLNSHGIGGKVWRWIESWLEDRQQRVCMDGVGSVWRRVTSCVPQGSVLGPILFLIFINDIDDGISNEILKFADDTKIFGKTSSQDCRDSMQKDTQILCSWARDWQIEFNVGKCKSMHFGTKNVLQDYKMNGQLLEKVTEEKDLGVMISNDLKVAAQCSQACNKANRMLGLMRRTISSRDPKILTKLYKSLVRPHLEYCVAAWSPHYKKDKEKIERVQHRFTRLFKPLRNLGYNTRLQKLGLWTLEERRNRADLIEVYKMCQGISLIPLDTFFERELDTRTRGHLWKLKKRHSRTDLRRHFFSNRVINRWNQLTLEAVMANSINSFKNQLQKLRDTRMGFFMD